MTYKRGRRVRKTKELGKLLLFLPMMDLGPQLPGRKGEHQKRESERARQEIQRAKLVPSSKPSSEHEGKSGQRKGIIGWLTRWMPKPKKR